ncbi:MAG TPA: hypothetical protein VGJ93_05690 [Desulfuromonadaceae bacterium]
MWENVKSKFHTAYFVILGACVVVAPWEIRDSQGSYKDTVYSLIIQPPHTPYPSYTVSIAVEDIIGHIIISSILFGIVYFCCKKFVWTEK